MTTGTENTMPGPTAMPHSTADPLLRASAELEGVAAIVGEILEKLNQTIRDATPWMKAAWQARADLHTDEAVEAWNEAYPGWSTLIGGLFDVQDALQWVGRTDLPETADA